MRLDDPGRKSVFDVQLDQPLSVHVNQQQLVQVFVNLLQNACYASPADKPITLLGQTSDNQVSVRVVNQGDAIEPDKLAHIFEPFFTTKPVGEGTGLGLSLVYSILAQHGGRVTAQSTASNGTSFEVNLPLAGSVDGIVNTDKSDATTTLLTSDNTSQSEHYRKP